MNSHTESKQIEGIIKFEQLKKLKFSFEQIYVRISYGDKPGFFFENCPEDMFEHKFENEKWIIYQKYTLNFQPEKGTSLPNAIIVLPKGLALIETELSLVHGSLYLEKLQSENLCIRLQTASLIAGTLSTKLSSISCYAGSITINEALMGKVKIDCILGNVLIKNSGSIPYGYKVNVWMGSVHTPDGKNYFRNEATSKLEIENFYQVTCKLGNVSIKP